MAEPGSASAVDGAASAAAAACVFFLRRLARVLICDGGWLLSGVSTAADAPVTVTPAAPGLFKHNEEKMVGFTMPKIKLKYCSFNIQSE